MGENQNDHDLLIGLNSKVDSIIETLKMIPPLEKRVRDVEINSGKQETNLETHKTEIDKLRNTNTVWSSLNSIFILVGSFLGIAIK
jgi:hypothetical protein